MKLGLIKKKRERKPLCISNSIEKKYISGWEKFYYFLTPIAAIVIAIFSIYLTLNFISKDKQVDMVQERRNDKRKLLIEASDLLNSRYFDNCRMIWTMEKIKNIHSMSANVLDELKSRDVKYNETLREYNIKVRLISRQIIYIFDDDISKLFSKENDDLKNPKSISGLFMKIHIMTDTVKRMIFDKKDINYADKIQKIKIENEKLLKKIIIFIDKMSKLTFSKDGMLEDLSNR